jgi:hypothetical protein
MNPAKSPKKIPTIKMLFVVYFLPELYIIIETYIKAPPAMDRNSMGATDVLCTLLNHPSKCLHDYDIPQGQCCIKNNKGSIK